MKWLVLAAVTLAACAQEQPTQIAVPAASKCACPSLEPTPHFSKKERRKLIHKLNRTQEHIDDLKAPSQNSSPLHGDE